MPIFTLVFLLAVFVQVVFFITLMIGFNKKVESASPVSLSPVSVIVCAHDEEANLRELVPQLLNQDYPDFEVIVVDDRSNDGTYDFLYNESMTNERLKLVSVTEKPGHITGKKFAITLGVKAANNEMLVLTDADCRPKNNQWLKTLASGFDNATDIVIGFSPYFRSNGILNSFIRFESIITAIQYVGLALLGKPYMGVGRNIAYRKSLFLRSKGFNGHLNVTGGDDDLFVNANATRKNTRLALGENALIYSYPKKNWTEFLVQKRRHLSVGRFYKFSDKLTLGLFAISWLSVWLLLIPALLEAALLYGVIVAVFTRWIFLISLLHSASRRLGDQFESWKVPVLDIIYAIYYLVTGLSALQSKRVRWKKI